MTRLSCQSSQPESPPLHPPGKPRATFATGKVSHVITLNRVTSINLVSRSITGSLPSNLNNLTQLKTLFLQSNSHSGYLLTLSNLTLLEEVRLDSNKFTLVPHGFFTGLINLQTFTISDNQDLKPWTLPNNIAQSANLKTFQASKANMYGMIPDVFDSLPNLQNLRLPYNDLTGSLPKSFDGSKIVNLWLNNQVIGLGGGIDVISLMTHVSQVWLQANAFTGAIPDLSKCVDLFDLQLRSNRLIGLVPNTITSLPKLVNITLQINLLQGPITVFRGGVDVGVTSNSFCLDTPGNCDPQVISLIEVAGALGYPMSLVESWQGNDACEYGWDFVSCDSSTRKFLMYANNYGCFH